MGDNLTFTDLIWIIPLFIAMLSVLVFVHELGHFMTARFFGITVEEFAIGFPPRAFAVRRNGIDYAINWLPLGGYVKIVGENGDSDDPHSFGKAPAWQRMIVLAAGSFMNLLLSIIIFTGLSLSGVQEATAPLTGVASVLAGQPADQGGIKPGDRIVSVAGTPVSNSDELRALSKANAGTRTAFVVNRNGEETTIYITPSATNVAPLGIGLAYWVSPAVVAQVRPGGAVDQAGVKAGDEIVAVNGIPVNNNLTASDLLISATTSWNRFISRTKNMITSHMTGEDNATATITVKRGGQTVGPLTIVIKDGDDPIGMALLIPQHTVYYSPPDALGRALGNTWEVVSSLPRGIRDALAGQAQGPGVTGPVGIGQLYAEVAQKLGIAGILNLTALLGISLFMINLLPLPALDGGRLLFIVIELLRGGRRIAPEKEGLAHMAGMVVLLTFIVIVSFFDVQRLFQGGGLLPK
jgi:regulator of sigma E protease